jgi:dipeptidyl-peptidase-4
MAVMRLPTLLKALLCLAPAVHLHAQATEEWRSWNRPVEPFRVVGNVYYVGANEMSVFLVATPEGHVLVDTGFEETVPIVRESMRKLGFRFEDVRYVLNTQAHIDHAGGHAAVVAATGAKVVSSAADAPSLRDGGKSDWLMGKDVHWPPVAVDRIVRDGDTVSIGGTVLTAHLTPGHTKGATTWTTKVQADGRAYDVVFLASTTVLPGVQLIGNAKYPAVADDFRRTFESQARLPCDVYLAAHASAFGMEEKAARAAKGETPNPFVDHGCGAYVAKSRASFEEKLARETAPGGGGSPAPARKPLTLDDLYDPETKVDASAAVPSGLTWLDDTHYLWPKTDPRTKLTEQLVVEADTGRAVPLFEAGRLESALAALPGLTADEARRLARQKAYVVDPKRTALVAAAGGDLYLFPLAGGPLVRLTRGDGAEDEVAFSPDGAWVSFVRGHDLYVVDRAGRREHRLTSDGSPNVLNGVLDWVYQEEIYGRGTFRGYWWSPDSRHLAFLRLDETRVPRYPVVDDTGIQPILEDQHYPKPGDANPEVRVGIVPREGGAARFLDLTRYAKDEPLVVSVSWSPRGDLAYEVQDRTQTWLDLNLADTAGASRTLFRETTKAWVEMQGPPRWLKDGGFLWESERSGFKHLYRYAADGRLIGPVTGGSWEARTFHGVDEAAGVVYFSGTERSPIGLDVYRIGLDGTGLRRLSERPGTHTAVFNGGFTRYLDSWSDIVTPIQVRLHRADGAETRVVEANPVPRLQEFALVRPELLQVPTRDGFPMEAVLFKPPDFDPSRRYPVYQHTYGGPQAPRVKDAWVSENLFHQLLAQKGIVVWICDNRTASGKGAGAAWPGYRRMGELELADIEDGLAWLRKQPWVDPTRIGIHGWSYGGMMTAYALTHSTSFAMGIAGAPVTDWRNYDSVYTERYMGLPAQNEDGYRRTSARLAARDLSGKLLLLHGSYDDNVHPGNTIQFAYELQRAGKPFEMMLLPKSRHTLTDPAIIRHMRTVMLDFIERTLLAR